MKAGYLPRVADAQLQTMLEAFGAVCIEGPKWCGKTWTALNQAASVVYMGSPEGNFQNRTIGMLDPSLVLQGAAPRLVDEWQEVPSLWDAVRHAVDQESARGRFILTGSATPAYKGIMHSGAGRIGRMRMHTMSLFESGDSQGVVSLSDVLKNRLTPVRIEETTLSHLIDWTVRGGWPGSIGLSSKAAAELPKAYLHSVVADDLHRMDGIRRDSQKMWMLLRSLARNESTLASHRALHRDMLQEEGDAINPETVSEYLTVLDRIFLREDQRAFSPNMRSSVRVGKSPKRHFADPSLAVAALGATHDRLLRDLHTFGFLFEALCERDLRIYAAANGAELYHYRDGSGREVDAVVECADGSWGAFEIKLGLNQLDEAAQKLLSIQQLMRQEPSAKAPSALCVLCGVGQYAYTREDGVMVVPIAALKP